MFVLLQLNANSMKKIHKLLVFIIGFFIILIGLIIYRYEKLLEQTRAEVSFGRVEGGATLKKYNAHEIISLIRSSKEYLGDSITIFDNGEMQSSNAKFQGTIQAVIHSGDNMSMVKSSMAVNRLPIQYNIYVLAATFYRNQYAAEISPALK